MRENNKRWIPYGFAAIAFVLCGCTTGITSRPVIDQVSKTEGIIYTLPKTYLQFTAKYCLWVEEPSTNASASRHGILLLDEKEGLTVTPILRPDPDQQYLLVSQEGGWSDVTDYLVKVSPNGSLEAVNANYQNKAAEVAGNLVSTAITIAKMVPMRDEPSLREFKKTDKSLIFTHTYDIEEFNPNNKNSTRPTTISDEINPIRTNACNEKVFEMALFKDEMINLKKFMNTSRALFDINLAYPELKWLKNEDSALGTNTIKAVLNCGNVSNSPPAIAVGNRLGGYDFLWWWKNDIIPGIVYRAPVCASLTVTIDGSPVLDTQVDIYQYGTIGYMDVRSHAFSKRTEKLAFSNGRVTQHDKSATSSVATATQLLSDQMPDLISAIQGLITSVKTNAPSQTCK